MLFADADKKTELRQLIRSISIVPSQSERIAQLTPVQNSSLGTIGVWWRTEVE